MSLFGILLFLHVMGAIAAFGPAYAAMVVGPMVAREPAHANFYARTQALVNKRLVTPLTLSLAVTGVLLVAIKGGPGAIGGGDYWLGVAILLYVASLLFALLVQAPAGRRLVELTSVPPTPGSPVDPEVPATARRVRTGGLVLVVLVLVITFLMVAKPF